MKLPGFTAEHSMYSSFYKYGKRFDQTHKVIPAQQPKNGGGPTESKCDTDLKADQDACDKQYDIDVASGVKNAEDLKATCDIEAQNKYNRCRRHGEAGGGGGIVIQ